MGKGKGGGQVIGHAYFLGLAYALCTRVDKLIKFKMNGDVTATPNLSASGEFVAKTGKTQSGGNGSGNSTSTVKFYDGSQSTPDGYISAKTKANIAYKNTAYLVVNGFIGDNVSAAPEYSAVVKRTNLGVSWDKNNTYADINGDINAAHALWYMLERLIGLSSEFLDEASFLSAAKKLFNERFGISFTMSSSKEASEWVKEILRTVDGVICINPKNSKLSLKLLRDDYDVASLKSIDEGSSANVKFTRKSWDDTYSKVIIKYTDSRNHNEASVSGINSATKRTIGYEKTYEVEYMAVSNATNANAVLQRVMKKMSYPFASIKFSVSASRFKEIMVGDVLLFTSSKLDIKDMRIRVLNVGGEKDAPDIEIEAIEDVFALKNVIVTSEQESLYEPVDLSIGEIEHFGAVEATIEDGQEQGVLPLMVAPSGFVQTMSVKDGLSGASVDIKGYTLGTLVNDFAPTGEIDDEASFVVSEITPLWEVGATRAGWQRLKMTCLIDNEYINFQYRRSLGGGRWEVKTLMRGLSNTPVTLHKAGTKVWFAPQDANDLIFLPIISPNTVLSFSASNFANTAQVKRLSFTHSGKSKKPYPISNLTASKDGDKVTLKWRNCVRLHGANYRSADVIPAGVNEGLAENDIIVKFGTQEELRVRSDSVEITNASVVTYTLYATSYKDGLLSEPVTITI